MSETDYLFVDGRSRMWIERPTWRSRSFELGDLDGVMVALFRGVITDDLPLPPSEQRFLVKALLLAFGTTLRVPATRILEWFPNATILDVQTVNLEASHLEDLLSAREFRCVAVSNHRWTVTWPILQRYGQSAWSLELQVEDYETFHLSVLRAFPRLACLRILGTNFGVSAPVVPIDSLTRVEIVGLHGHLDISKSFPNVIYCSVIGSWQVEGRATISGLQDTPYLKSLDLANCAILGDTEVTVDLVEFWASSCDLHRLTIADPSRVVELSLLDCEGASTLMRAPFPSLRSLSVAGQAGQLNEWRDLASIFSLESLVVSAQKVVMRVWSRS